MSVVHRVTGYDKRSEILSIEYDIPPNKLHLVRGILQAPTDPDLVGSYPLAADEARRLASMLHNSMLAKDISEDRYDWFVEPFSE